MRQLSDPEEGATNDIPPLTSVAVAAPWFTQVKLAAEGGALRASDPYGLTKTEAPPGALIVPVPSIVMLVPSGLTTPTPPEVASETASVRLALRAPPPVSGAVVLIVRVVWVLPAPGALPLSTLLPKAS